MIYEGAISVKAILEGKVRNIEHIYIDENKRDRNTNYIIKKAKSLNVDVVFLKREEIDKMASGKTHGGIICEASSRLYQSLEDCISHNSFITVIDGIEDPFNLGYALRTLYAFGCSGVILHDKDYSKGDSVMVKSSAGASEKINIYLTNDLKNDLLCLKNHGLKVISMQRDDSAKTLFDTDFKGPFVLILGGEKRGINKEILALSDEFCYIPYANDFRNALNATSAISCMAVEIVRQRNYK